MMPSKQHESDRDGKFGVPDVMAAGVTARMDQQHPAHPLQRSEEAFAKNKDVAELEMLCRMQGIGAPLKMKMERTAAQKVGHLPCISSASRASYEALTGQDSTINFEDVLGRPDMFESLPGLPHDVIEKSLAAKQY